MREWVSQLDEIDRDCVHRYEYLLGRKLKGFKEYQEIDNYVEEMVLEYDSRKEFFEKYPELKLYRRETC